MSASKIRLNKRLVELGLAPSRRKADELIIDRQVKLNGQIVTNLASVVEPSDRISVAGKVGSARADIYVAYNKPTGEVCSHVGQAGDKTIFDNLPKSFANLKIAGRLDKNSEGLVILSSDGNFVQNVSHPSQGKAKQYIVTLEARPAKSDIQKLENGIELDHGLAKANKVRLLPDNRVSLELQEGRKRQIRRMFEAIGKPVVRLERIQIGSYHNDQLKPGEYVFIKPGEVLE